MPKRRAAAARSKRSAMKAQKTLTANRLKTEVQMKNDARRRRRGRAVEDDEEGDQVRGEEVIDERHEAAARQPLDERGEQRRARRRWRRACRRRARAAS